MLNVIDRMKFPIDDWENCSNCWMGWMFIMIDRMNIVIGEWDYGWFCWMCWMFIMIDRRLAYGITVGIAGCVGC